MGQVTVHDYNRDFQSHCRANLRILSHPCEFQVQGAGPGERLAADGGWARATDGCTVAQPSARASVSTRPPSTASSWPPSCLTRSSQGWPRLGADFNALLGIPKPNLWANLLDFARLVSSLSATFTVQRAWSW